jgi:hypothetical protein
MMTSKPQLWTSGDWNAFFGFGTNILVNLLTLTALLRFVLKMPDDLVNIPLPVRRRVQSQGRDRAVVRRQEPRGVAP